MKFVVRIALPISLIFNVYFLYQVYENYQFHKITSNNLFSIKKISFPSGTNYLLNRLKKEQPQLINKNYIFINIWNIGCGPCIKEMPILDSLSLNINRKDIGYVFLTENSKDLITSFLKRKKIITENFVFINDANDYISSVLNEKGIKNKAYPIQLIIDKNGTIIHFDRDIIKNSKDTALINLIENLP